MKPQLAVIVPYENPMGYSVRSRLMFEFCMRMARTPGVLLIVSELLYAGQSSIRDVLLGPLIDDNNWVVYTATTESCPLWHKENLINRALLMFRGSAYSNLPVAWMDGDIAFVRPDWVAATLAALEDAKFVQMFSHAMDLGPNYQPSTALTGFINYTLNGGNSLDPHPYGFAWAAQSLDSLCDVAVVGSGDMFTAWMLVGHAIDSRVFPPSLVAAFEGWRRQVGMAQGAMLQHPTPVNFVDGTVLHYWHGSRYHRQGPGRPVWTSARGMLKLGFDAQKDLTYNEQGILEFVNPDCLIAQAIQEYYAARNDDSRATTSEDEGKIRG